MERGVLATTSIYHSAVALLARREHSRLELLQKLGSKFPDQKAAVDDVLQKLIDRGEQSDQRFAEAYLRARSARGFGPERLRLELRERGVDARIAEQAFHEVESQGIDWFDLCCHAWQKKYGRAAQDQDPLKAKAKQIRFLQYRGFSEPTIRAVLTEQTQ